MIFIYWGWDTAVSVNEETKDRNRNPGLAAIISTVILLATYFLVTLAVQSYAGIGSTGVGLTNPANVSDVLYGARELDIRDQRVRLDSHAPACS